MAAAEFFEDQFQCDLSKFEPVSAIWSFIVSLYPLIALLKDDGEFNALRFDPYFNDISEDYKNITRQINRIITETAIPLIEESRDEFSDLAKEDDIPWRQLDPFSRSLINLVAADAPHFHKLCLNFYAKFMEDKKTTSEKIFNFTVVAGIILLMIGIYLLTSGTAAPALAVGAKAGMIALLVTDCVGFTFQYFEEKQNETYNRIALVSQSLEELKEGTLAENVFYYFLTLLIMHYLFKGAGRLIREFKARKIIATEIPELKKTIESFGPEHVSHAKKSIDADIRSAEETLKKLAAKGPAVAESPEPGKLGIFSTLRETVAKDPAQNPRGLREGSIAQSTKDIERLHKKFDADLVAMAKKLDINLEQTLAVADRFGFKDANMLLLLELDFETAQLKRFLNVKKQLLQLEAEIEKTKQELDSLRKSRQALKKKSAPHKQAGHDIDQKLAVKKLLLEEKSKLLVVLNFLKGTRTPQSLGDWGEQLVSSESNYLTPLRRNVAALDAFTRDNLPVSVKSIFLDELATYSLRKDPYFAIVRGEGKIKEAVNLFINNWDLAVKEVPTSFVPPRYLPPKPESIDKIIHLVYVTSPPPPAVQAAVSEALSAFLQEEAAAYKSIRYSLRITYKSKFELFSAFKPEQVKQLKTLVFPKAISLPGIGRKKPAQED